MSFDEVQDVAAILPAVSPSCLSFQVLYIANLVVMCTVDDLFQGGISHDETWPNVTEVSLSENCSGFHHAPRIEGIL